MILGERLGAEPAWRQYSSTLGFLAARCHSPSQEVFSKPPRDAGSLGRVVSLGPSANVVRPPRHPYTHRLSRRLRVGRVESLGSSWTPRRAVAWRARVAPVLDSCAWADNSDSPVLHTERRLLRSPGVGDRRRIPRREGHVSPGPGAFGISLTEPNALAPSNDRTSHPPPMAQRVARSGTHLSRSTPSTLARYRPNWVAGSPVSWRSPYCLQKSPSDWPPQAYGRMPPGGVFSPGAVGVATAGGGQERSAGKRCSRLHSRGSLSRRLAGSGSPPEDVGTRGRSDQSRSRGGARAVNGLADVLWVLWVLWVSTVVGKA